jgi:hypothetical protein
VSSGLAPCAEVSSGVTAVPAAGQGQRAEGARQQQPADRAGGQVQAGHGHPDQDQDQRGRVGQQHGGGDPPGEVAPGRQRRGAPPAQYAVFPGYHQAGGVAQVGHAHRAQHDQASHPGREHVRGGALTKMLDPAQLQCEQRSGQDQAGHERPRGAQQQGQLIAHLARDHRPVANHGSRFLPRW